MPSGVDPVKAGTVALLPCFCLATSRSLCSLSHTSASDSLSSTKSAGLLGAAAADAAEFPLALRLEPCCPHIASNEHESLRQHDSPVDG